MSEKNSLNWSFQTISDVELNLKTSATRGLSESEAKRRYAEHGPNEIKIKNERSFFQSFIEKILNPISLILLLSGIVLVSLDMNADAFIIFLTFFINLFIGLIQEGKASKAFQKLRHFQKFPSIVIRGGKKKKIPSEELTIGDLVLLRSGIHIPADMRIVRETDLSINEAALTGEWDSIKKNTMINAHAPKIFEAGNMAWKGTLVVDGYGAGIVTEIGKDTQIGKISETLLEKGGRTPLQKATASLARFLTFIIVFAIALIFILGFLRGFPIADLFLTSIAVAVAAIPTGLPVAITFVLVLGMITLLKNGGLVRSLLATETLGSTTLIISDKTGTITKGQMRLQSLILPDGREFRADGEREDALSPSERRLLLAALWGTDGQSVKEGDKDSVTGSPIDRGIYDSAKLLGITRESTEKYCVRMAYCPFHSNRGYSSSINKDDKGLHTYTVGTPEKIIEASKYTTGSSGILQKIESGRRKKLFELLEKYTKRGDRVIGVSYTPIKDFDGVNVPKQCQNFMQDSHFLGFLLFTDPIRVGVAESVKDIESKGVRVVIATGDNQQTAVHIAKEVGIADDENNKGPMAINGSDLEEMGDSEYDEITENTQVFSRMSPKQKLQLCKSFQERGEIVAMTGDGINDAPALHHASIGIALNSGTEVAKEASDLILVKKSGNFSTIVRAIEEGRKIAENIRKIVLYLLSTSFSEIILVGSAVLVGVAIPLLPAQILWANLIEEAFISFAFAFEKGTRDAPAQRRIITKEMKRLIMAMALITGATLSALYFVLLQFDLSIEVVRTIVFVALSIDSMFLIFSLKNLRKPCWRTNLFDNKHLVGAIAISIVLLFLAFFITPLQNLLSLTEFSYIYFVIGVLVGIIDLILIEIAKRKIINKTPDMKTAS
ncbi:MAG: HAD-IC family P-type ATPase [Candidatus Campbellbacteria bacterium]|nr:HAD-IC family P-type ATPase [Candidatus Campbellbacteria bacterium]